MVRGSPIKVLVVCLGNICRSPTGEAVLRAKAQALGVNVEVDSCGTSGYHAGEAPDRRSAATAKKRGISFAGITSRQVRQEDFEHFDYILAADRSNMVDLQEICPVEHEHKLSLFLSHGDSDYSEIPDPYYGGEQGFETVLDLIEQASEAFLQKTLNFS